ncbi:MAG: aldo/keto reductase, partial [Candidatus Poribacteria bacterium]
MYNLSRIKLGRTGLIVTRLGIGGAYCKTPEGYISALDCGVNYIDTARVYNDKEDERIIGEAIQGRRNGLILATKTQRRDAEGARKDLETSLSLLKTDYIDIYQLHHLNTQLEREQALASGGALEEVLKAREEGLVR